MSEWTADSRRYRQQRQEFLAAFTICWICGHPGADQIDHVIPVGPPHFGPKFDPAFWRPAHGWRGCPGCGRKCNQERGRKLTLPKSSPRSRRW